MDISEDVLRKSFRAMSDEELLRRWEAQSFTDEARPIAKAEIDARHLDVSSESLRRVHAADLEDSMAIKRRQRTLLKGYGTKLLVLFGLPIIVIVLALVAALVHYILHIA